MFAAPAFGSVNGVVKCGRRFTRHVDRSACSDFAIRILDAAVRAVATGVCTPLAVPVSRRERTDDGGDAPHRDRAGRQQR
ncbi:Uncharacterised protein [Mycobacterium tuberculosis]|uniref:Uncharacterized protein n=1 Tax=Mycobacterium tuberculosis TaxID=1773 RepID=A0A916LFG9_MYCTX|nr:Uncharacterised protein [Mycobacterium tuberculosis]